MFDPEGSGKRLTDLQIELEGSLFPRQGPVAPASARFIDLESGGDCNSRLPSLLHPILRERVK